MKALIWKIISLVLIGWSIIAGLIIKVPELPLIGESIRNIFFHVCMWFTMIFLLIYSFINSIKYLSTNKIKYDETASSSVDIALIFGILGVITGMIWAKFTWGKFWLNDPKLNGAAISMLAYFAYKILRNSINNLTLKRKISSIYNIFAFVILLTFIFVLPKISETSIHPGKYNTPVLPTQISLNMKIILYPAILGWIILSYWLLNMILRFKNINSIYKKLNNERT